MPLWHSGNSLLRLDDGCLDHAKALGHHAADLTPLLNASEVRCFERAGLPATLQLSSFPALAESGVRYFRGSTLETQVLPRYMLRFAVHSFMC